MSIGRLRRHLDLDLIARMRAGIKHKPQTVKHISDPRPAATYRCNRRLAVRARRTAELLAKRTGRAA